MWELLEGGAAVAAASRCSQRKKKILCSRFKFAKTPSSKRDRPLFHFLLAAMSGTNPSVYSAKCLNGPYVDRRKEPDFEGVRPSVQTEQQIRNAVVCGLANPTFGASLRSTFASVKTMCVIPSRRAC